MERNHTNYSAERHCKKQNAELGLVQKTIENYIKKSNLGF